MAARAIRGVHVLWMICGFFAVIIALDSLFVFWALRSFPGEQVKNSYVVGLDYNSEVAQRRAQEKLGWTAEAGLVSDAGQQLVVRMRSAGGEAVTGLRISTSLHVPGERQSDSIDLVELAPGEYVAPVDLEGRVRIEAAISAKRAGDAAVVFKAAKTLVAS